MKKFLIILFGVLLMFSGFVLITRPIEAFSTFGYIMALTLLLNGVANIIIWFKVKEVMKVSIWYLISAIISVVFALTVCGDVLFKIAFETVLVYMIAIWFLITGVLRIVLSFNIRKEYKEYGNESCKNWWLILLLGLSLLICGIMCVYNPFVLVVAIGLNLGINMVFCGIDLITLATIF